MPNNLATVQGKLATALRDTGYAVWAQAEQNDLLTWSAAMLYQRGIAREIMQDITLTADVSAYTLTSIRDISRVDLYDTTNTMVMPLPPGTWEGTGDGWTTYSLFLNNSYALQGYHAHVWGRAPFDLTTNLPPDELVPVLIAMARAEALRRALNDRAKTENWLALNQTQNVTVNELIMLVNEADNEAERLVRTMRQSSRPVPARIR